jgi:hypothetical protein
LIQIEVIMPNGAPAAVLIQIKANPARMDQKLFDAGSLPRRTSVLLRRLRQWLSRHFFVVRELAPDRSADCNAGVARRNLLLPAVRKSRARSMFPEHARRNSDAA